MRKLTQAHIKECLKLVEQKVKDEMTPSEDTANNASGKGKSSRRLCYLCFHCDKPGHIKVKCYKWLATDEGKEYTKNNPTEDEKEDEAKHVDQGSRQMSRSNNLVKKKPGSGNARIAWEDSEDNYETAWMAREVGGPANA